MNAALGDVRRQLEIDDRILHRRQDEPGAERSHSIAGAQTRLIQAPRRWNRSDSRSNSAGRSDGTEQSAPAAGAANFHDPDIACSRRKACSHAAHSDGRSVCTMSRSRSSRIVSYSWRSRFPSERIFCQGCSGLSAAPASPGFVAASLIRSRHRSKASQVLRSSSNASRSMPCRVRKNGVRVFDYVLQSPCGFFRRQWRGSGQSAAGSVPVAQALPPRPQDIPELPSGVLPNHPCG